MKSKFDSPLVLEIIKLLKSIIIIFPIIVYMHFYLLICFCLLE